MSLVSLLKSFIELPSELRRQRELLETQGQLIAKVESDVSRRRESEEQLLLVMGKLLAQSVRSMATLSTLADAEFKIFSQWGDDGIIQWLVHNLKITNKTFIEFGVDNYRESNTRFLMMNNNWSGFVMDGSAASVAQIVKSEYFWKHELSAKAVFINCENINDLLRTSGFQKELGLLHIDLDGNDYWIWKAIDSYFPIILILEYNSVFGIDRAITVPYNGTFYRTTAHHSNLYFGASLRALWILSNEKGYSFVGCNSAGNNAYFVRTDQLNNRVTKVSLQDGYVPSRFRESRDIAGKLTFLDGPDRLNAMRGLPVYNVETDLIEPL